jgi:peptidoglycan/LPS O-acetylase OafA/YrhL
MYRWRQHAWTFRAAGILVIALGAVCYILSPTQFYDRDGYTELFYPPVLAFLLIASGVVLLLFTFANHALLRNNAPLARLGRCSLLMYIAHLAILHWFVTPLVGEVELGIYLVLYAALLLLLVGLAGAVELGKQRFPRRLPFMLRLLLGS